MCDHLRATSPPSTVAGDTTFASRSVPVHLARGVVGLGLLVASFALVPLTGALSLLLALPGLLALRGCPTCWLLGLAQTRERTRARTPDQARGSAPDATRAVDERECLACAPR